MRKELSISAGDFGRAARMRSAERSYTCIMLTADIPLSMSSCWYPSRAVTSSITTTERPDMSGFHVSSLRIRCSVDSEHLSSVITHVQ